MRQQLDPMLLVLGYQRAVGRLMTGGEPLHSVTQRHLQHLNAGEGESVHDEPVPESAFYVALFESLNWAVTVDERLWQEWHGVIAEPKAWYREIEYGEAMRGIRFARNRVHHQWSAAIELPAAAQDRTLLRAHAFSWTWAWPLPPGRPDSEGERIYEKQLAGEPVVTTLTALSPALIAGVQTAAAHRRGH